MKSMKSVLALILATLLGQIGALTANAQEAIKIGQTMPYSGPAATLGIAGRAASAYFNMVNDMGGIGGRKIELLSLDDGAAPPKAVEQTRRLVERDKVIAMFGSIGTAAQTAVSKYLIAKKIPLLFVGSGATQWSDPTKFPYTVPWHPSYVMEGAVYAHYILDNVKDPKVSIVYVNDDAGRDFVKGMKDGLGDRAKDIIVSELGYNQTDVNVDSQVIAGQAAGANVEFTIAAPKAAAQIIEKMNSLNWKPQHFLASVGNSIEGTLRPAGFEKSQGIMSAFFMIDPKDATVEEAPAIAKYKAFVAKYAPDLDPNEGWVVYGYTQAQAMEAVIRAAGSDVSSENLLKQARNLDFHPNMLASGIDVRTSEAEKRYAPISALRLARFEGDNWVPIGTTIDTAPRQ